MSNNGSNQPRGVLKKLYDEASKPGNADMDSSDEMVKLFCALRQLKSLKDGGAKEQRKGVAATTGLQHDAVPYTGGYKDHAEEHRVREMIWQHILSNWRQRNSPNLIRFVDIKTKYYHMTEEAYVVHLLQLEGAHVRPLVVQDSAVQPLDAKKKRKWARASIPGPSTP